MGFGKIEGDRGGLQKVIEVHRVGTHYYSTENFFTRVLFYLSKKNLIISH
jgi:hypothetical protein